MGRRMTGTTDALSRIETDAPLRYAGNGFSEVVLVRERWRLSRDH